MSRPLLDLVQERIASRIRQAEAVFDLRCIGAWLGVFSGSSEWNRPEGVMHYRDVVEAASVVAMNDSSNALDYFSRGIEWLQQRRFFVPDQPRNLESDPIGCLILSLAVNAEANDKTRQWLIEIVDRAESEEKDLQRQDMFSLATLVLKNDDPSWSRISPLLATATAHKLGRRATEQQRREAQEVLFSVDGPDIAWSVFHASAMKIVFAMQASIDVTRPTIEQVAAVLRGIPSALKRWPWEGQAKTRKRGVTAQRWDIQHEYHVQSLAWALLRPIFPGLEDEEYLPSLGHKHPRADLLVPSLRLVIEAKFLREATQSARSGLINEIAADTGLYRAPGSGYDFIISLIWDATASSNHHSEIESGLRKLPGIADVIIVSRPGEWGK